MCLSGNTDRVEMEANSQNVTIKLSEAKDNSNQTFSPAIYVSLLVPFVIAVMILRKNRREVARQFILRTMMPGPVSSVS